MIEDVVIDGRPATAAYIDADWEPVAKDKAALIKVIFHDGEDVLFLKPPGVIKRLRELVERDVDYIQDPATGHLMGSHPHGGDKEGGDKDQKPEDKPGEKPAPDPEVMEVGGDEWNKQTAERLEKEYVEAVPALDKIVKEAVNQSVDITAGGPDADDAPPVPDEWDAMSGDQMEQVESEWKDFYKEDYYNSEVENWQENSATDDAGSEMAYKFTKEGNNAEWASDAIADYRKEREESGKSAIPFTDQQLLDALKVDYSNTGYNDVAKGLSLEFDDTKLGDPIGFQPGQGTLPGMEAMDPEDYLSEDMRQGLVKALTASYATEAQDVASKMDPPDYLSESVSESMDSVWGEMSEKEKFAFASDHTDIIKDAQEEYDKYFGDSTPEQGVIDKMPKQFDPLESGKSPGDYMRTRLVAKHLSIERSAQIMVKRGIYTDVDEARKDAKYLDNSLWESWKSSSHGSGGQLLQKATADELGGRLNPNMLTLTQQQLESQSEGIAINAAQGKAYDAVKAYIRGKWETTQYMLDKAGDDTVNVFRAVNITDAMAPTINETTILSADKSSAEAQYNVRTQKTFDTKDAAMGHAKAEMDSHPGSDYNVFGHHASWIAEVNYHFKERSAADKFVDDYVKDPANPAQHTEQVKEVSPQTGNILSHYDRLPDINVKRNGAASTTTDLSVANKWDGSSGRVVLRATVPRTAVLSVPAYGINVHGEHEVVVTGTAWKGWDAWYGRAPKFDNIKIGHQVAP